MGYWLDDDGGNGRGAVYILFFERTVKADQKIFDTIGNFQAGLDDENGFGTSIAGIGDLDGDGNVDVVVGAPSHDDGVTGRGAVCLFLNTDGIGDRGAENLQHRRKLSGAA